MGAALSKAGARRTTPLATATLVVAANAPDVDMLAFARGEYFALAFRRGITHGWPAMLLLPLAVAAAMLAWDRWVRRRRDPHAAPARAGPIVALSYLGVATHPGLDWMNTYGMRWGMPFDPSWSYGDALFIIDPWIWLTLGGAVFMASAPGRTGLRLWALLAVLTSALILLAPVAEAAKVLWVVWLAMILVRRKFRRTGPSSTTVPRLAVGVTAAYIALMVASDLAARPRVRDAARSAGYTVRDLMVAPLPADPFGAELEVLTDRGYLPGTFRWLPRPDVRLSPDRLVPLMRAPPELDAAARDRIVDAAREVPDAAHYLVWSRYPYVEIRPHGDGWAVTFRDARYDDRPGVGGLGGVTVQVEG